MSTQSPSLSAPASTIPAHVPAALVRDFDYMRADPALDVYDWWRQLHDGPEIFFTPRHGGHWVVTRYEDIAHVLETHGLDVRSAHVSTLGADVVDAFYVPVLTDPALRERLVQDLLTVLP